MVTGSADLNFYKNVYKITIVHFVEVGIVSVFFYLLISETLKKDFLSCS